MSNENVDYDGNSYSKYRPSYSDEIFSLTYKFHQGAFDQAIDSGTGTGQVAVELSKKFKHVYGIDYLAAQIESATPRDNITYRVGPGEDFSSFEDHSIDLITVATAFHWFDHEKFFAEAKRVLKPKGTLAIFGYFYPLLQNHPEVNEAIQAVWKETFGEYTNSNVRFVSNMYRDIQFPFKEQQWYITPKSQDTTHISLPTEGPLMALQMPVKNYLNFFLTSSAYQNYLKNKKTEQNKEDPVEYLSKIVMKALNTEDSQTLVNVEWPTVLVLARND